MNRDIKTLLALGAIIHDAKCKGKGAIVQIGRGDVVILDKIMMAICSTLLDEVNYDN